MICGEPGLEFPDSTGVPVSDACELPRTARDLDRRDGCDAARHSLTSREIDLLQCTSQYLGAQESADALGIAVASIRRLQATLVWKLRISGGRLGLMRWLASQVQAWVRECVERDL